MIKYSKSSLKNTTLFTIIAWSLLSSTFFSCASRKSIIYFQGQGAVDTARYATLASLTPTTIRIQVNDVLAIVVSSLSDETNSLFNVQNTITVTQSSFSGGSGGSQPLGYLVDSAGEVNLSLVGKVKVAGMTLKEADAYVKQKLSQYLKEPTVNIRLLNHKFTVIGEVTRPGVYNLLDNKITLPEVIGIAGDLTVYGRRDNVMFIRTTDDKREIVRLDLTSRQILNSPYYFIRNDDVLYVEARPGKITSTNRFLQVYPIFLGTISTLALILNIFK